MQIERVEELRLSNEQEAAIANLLASNFSVNFEGRSFFQNRHHVRFLHYHGEGLQGHAAISYRAIQLGNARVDIIGIGEVAVAKQAREQGIGSTLIQAAIEEGIKAQADFALLFGEQSIYGAAGFVPVPNRIRLVEMEGARTKEVVEEDNSYLMVLPLGDQQWDTSADVDLAGFAF